MIVPNRFDLVHRENGLGHAATFGLIEFFVIPQREQQHRELACDGDDRLFLRTRRPVGELEAVTLECAVGAEGSEDVLCGADQQSSQIGVAAVPLMRSCLSVSPIGRVRDQTEIGGDVVVAAEACGIANGEHEGQRGDELDAVTWVRYSVSGQAQRLWAMDLSRSRISSLRLSSTLNDGSTRGRTLACARGRSRRAWPAKQAGLGRLESGCPDS